VARTTVTSAVSQLPPGAQSGCNHYGINPLSRQAKTTVGGRDPGCHGHPIKIAELVAQLDGTTARDATETDTMASRPNPQTRVTSRAHASHWDGAR